MYHVHDYILKAGHSVSYSCVCDVCREWFNEVGFFLFFLNFLLCYVLCTCFSMTKAHLDQFQYSHPLPPQLRELGRKYRTISEDQKKVVQKLELQLEEAKKAEVAPPPPVEPAPVSSETTEKIQVFVLVRTNCTPSVHILHYWYNSLQVNNACTLGFMLRLIIPCPCATMA